MYNQAGKTSRKACAELALGIGMLGGRLGRHLLEGAQLTALQKQNETKTCSLVLGFVSLLSPRGANWLEHDQGSVSSSIQMMSSYLQGKDEEFEEFMTQARHLKLVC